MLTISMSIPLASCFVQVIVRWRQSLASAVSGLATTIAQVDLSLEEEFHRYTVSIVSLLIAALAINALIFGHKSNVPHPLRVI